LFKPADFQNLSPDYNLSLFNLLFIPEPTTYAQATDDPRWVEAIDKEISTLEANNT